MPPEDPYAAYGGSIAPPLAQPAATPQPAQPADPYAEFGGSVATSQPTPTTPDAESPLSTIAGRMTLPALKQRLEDLNTGIGRGFDSLMIPAETILQHLPGVGHILVPDSAIAHDRSVVGAPDPNDPERAANQGAGSDIESLLEFMTGEKGVDAAARGLGVVERLKTAGKIGKIIEEYPGLARVLGVASKNAVVAGGQAAAHGGDAGDVATSAIVTGGTAGALEGLPVAADAFTSARAPKTRTIAGEKIPVLASQEPGASSAAKAAADITSEPEYQKAQQEGGQNAVRNIAQDATRKVLNQVNATRQPLPIETNPARMLPAPADMKPFGFTLEMGTPSETVEGTTAQTPATKAKQIGTRIVEGKGPAQQPKPTDNFNLDAYNNGESPSATVEPAEPPQDSQTVYHKEPQWRITYANESAPGQQPGRDVVSGPGVMTTTDPNVARQTLSQLQDIAEGNGFEKLSPTGQQQVQRSIATLTDQLRQYGDTAARSPHFQPVDVEGAAQHTSNFQEAADHIEAAVQPIYQKLDELSENQFSALRSQGKAQDKIIRNPSSPSAYDAAVERKSEVNRRIEEIFDKNREYISPQERQVADQSWRMASTARDIHATIESTMNGVGPDVAASENGIVRTMKGGTPAYKRLSKLLSDRGDDVRSLIGDEGVNNLYRISDLLKTPDKAKDFGGLMKNIANVLKTHGGRLGGLTGTVIAGGAFSHALGMPAYYGLLAGAAGEAAYRKVANAVATNPAIAERVSYALKNGVSSRISAPLIASMLTKQAAVAAAGNAKDNQKQELQQPQ